MGCPTLLRISSIVAVATVLSVAAPAPQDQAKVSINPRETQATAKGKASMRIDVRMILVPITVMDPLDHPIENLRPDAFRIFEDNVEQRIVSLSKEEGPVSVGFIFDASSSMKNRIDRSVEAIQQFLRGTMPGDEYFLVRFSDQPTMMTRFTSDTNYISSELASIQPYGWTALNDAIYMGTQQMKHAKNKRRALFVLTDGDDNNSRYSENEVKNLVVESDVRVYAVGLFSRPKFLEKLAALTGGEALWARSLKELPDTIDRISREFRNQYMIGYSSNNPQNDGKYRQVRVEIAGSLQRALHLFWRRGYFALPE